MTNKKFSFVILRSFLERPDPLHELFDGVDSTVCGVSLQSQVPVVRDEDRVSVDCLDAIVDGRSWAGVEGQATLQDPVIILLTIRTILLHSKAKTVQETSLKVLMLC